MALTRADLPRPHTATGDPDAQRRLCTGMAATPPAWLRAALAVRTRFFDDHVLAAISAGIGQIVILGAGYDDRALRFRSPGTRFFEIDHPSTQDDKSRRLRTMGVDTEGLVMAPVDFRRGDVGSVLADCGHQSASPTVFICEGLLVYLDQPTIAGLLGALRSRAAARSRLAASLATHPEGIDSGQVTAMANNRRRGAAVEPWLTILPGDLHLRMLTGAGWVVERSTDASQLDDGVVPGRCLLVSAQPAAPSPPRGR